MTKEEKLQGQQEETSTKKSTCIINTGIPYSGKGIVSGILYYLGINTGKHGKHKSLYSQKDDYEEATFATIHLQITGTQHRKSVLDSMHRYLSSRKPCKYNKDQEAGVRQYISVRSKSQLWATHDMRLCVPYIFEEFLPILKEVAEPILIVTDRELIDIAVNYPHYQVDANYVIEALMGYQAGRNRIFQRFTGRKMVMSFEDSVFSPKETVKKIADFVGVHITSEACGFAVQRVVNYKNSQCVFPEAKKYKRI